MTNQKYKNLTLREFDTAAEKFDDDDLSVYNLCRKDYPDLLEELLKGPGKKLWSRRSVFGTKKNAESHYGSKKS